MFTLIVFLLVSMLLVFMPYFFSVITEDFSTDAKLLFQKRRNLHEIQGYLTRNFVVSYNQFKYMMSNDFSICFLWIEGAILWILGVSASILQTELAYALFSGLSILFCTLALFVRVSKIPSDAVSGDSL
jgi:hypothetical protein